MPHDDDNLLAGFGALISAMSGGGGRGNPFPQSDAEDLGRGASWIPDEVTLARRDGQKVNFVQVGSQGDWYWELPNGKHISHG